MSDPFNIPIISLELSAMKLSVKHAITQRQLDLDAMLTRALDEYLTPDNIEQVIRAQTVGAIDAVVREEVDRFYRIGGGRARIAAEVRRRLEDE